MKKILIYLFILICICILSSATMSYYKFYPVSINIFQEKFNLTSDTTLIPVIRIEGKNISPTFYKQYISNIIIYDSVGNSNDSLLLQQQHEYYNITSLGDSSHRWEKLHVNYAYFIKLYGDSLYFFIDHGNDTDTTGVFNLCSLALSNNSVFATTTTKYKLYIIKNDSGFMFTDTTRDPVDIYDGGENQDIFIQTLYLLYNNKTSTYDTNYFEYNGYIEIMCNMIIDSFDYYSMDPTYTTDIPIFYKFTLSFEGIKSGRSQFTGRSDTILNFYPISVYNSSGFSCPSTPIYLPIFSDIYYFLPFDMINLNFKQFLIKLNFNHHFVPLDEYTLYEANVTHLRLVSDRMAILVAYTKEDIISETYTDTANIILK